MFRLSRLNRKSAGFTLAELLVVIAIVALLSSIVVVYTKEAGEKARVAKLLQFDSSIRHAPLAVDILGEWNFDIINGTTVKDTSGNDRDGTLIGNASQTTGSEWKWALGESVQFSAWGDYVSVFKVFPELKAFTISAWVNTGDNQWMLATLASVGNVRLSLFQGDLGFGIKEGPPAYTWDQLDCPVGDDFFKSGKWHHIIASYDSSNMSIYLDAEKRCEKPTNVKYIPETIVGGFKIGGLWGNGLIGLVDQVRFYAEGLPSAQIKKLYVEGIEKRGLVAE